jgi:hypothetical protein
MPHVIGIVGFFIGFGSIVAASLVVTMSSCTGGFFTPAMLAIVAPNVGLALIASICYAWCTTRRVFEHEVARCGLDAVELPLALIGGAVFAVAHAVIFAPCSPIYASLAVGVLSASLSIAASAVTLPLMIGMREQWELRKDIAHTAAETERRRRDQEQLAREAVEAHNRANEMAERAAAEARERAAALAASVAPVRAKSPRRRRAH